MNKHEAQWALTLLGLSKRAEDAVWNAYVNGYLDGVNGKPFSPNSTAPLATPLVARFDAMTQDEHAAGIAAARERAKARRGPRRQRALDAVARMTGRDDAGVAR